MKRAFLLLSLLLTPFLLNANAQNEIVVKTAWDFINAIGSDRTIIIDSNEPLVLSNLGPERFDNRSLSHLPEYKYYEPQKNLQGVGWYDMHDGIGFAICGIKNLTIKSGGGAKLLTIPRYADVLLFDRCENLTIENVIMGHTWDGYCEAGVLELRNCTNVKLDGCDLYGCGTEAIIMDKCMYVEVKNSELHHCTYHSFHLNNSVHICFRNCRIHDNKEYEQINIYGCRDVWFDNCTFANLKGPLFGIDCLARFYGCHFDANRNSDEFPHYAVQEPTLHNTDIRWQKWVQITGSNLNLRVGPSTDEPSQGTYLWKGEYAPVLDETDEWVKIYLPFSFLGHAWVSKKYTKETSPSAVPDYLHQRCTHDLLVASGNYTKTDKPEWLISCDMYNGYREVTLYGMQDEETQTSGIKIRLQEISDNYYYFRGQDVFNGYDYVFCGQMKFTELPNSDIMLTITQTFTDEKEDPRLPKQLVVRRLTQPEIEAKQRVERWKSYDIVSNYDNYEATQEAEEMVLRDAKKLADGEWRCVENDDLFLEFHPSRKTDRGYVYWGQEIVDDKHDIVGEIRWKVIDSFEVTQIFGEDCREAYVEARIDTGCAHEENYTAFFYLYIPLKGGDMKVKVSDDHSRVFRCPLLDEFRDKRFTFRRVRE